MTEDPPPPNAADLLAQAVEVLIPMIPTRPIDCRGGKCRLPICEGCFDEATAAKAAQEQLTATELARTILAIYHKGKPCPPLA